MRKSGTFTGLDFAPPPRFKNEGGGGGGGSDNGSIRSARSNHSVMSQSQVQNIRKGAYRLSRVPKELVGSKQDLAQMLKPTMNLGRV